MEFDINHYAFRHELPPVRISRELARQQPDMIPIEQGIWECNLPSFRVVYAVKKVENDDERANIPMVSIFVKQVQTRMIRIDMDTAIANIKLQAQQENKDVVFFKYRKWALQIDIDDNFQKRSWLPMRFCLIDREFEENA